MDLVTGFFLWCPRACCNTIEETVFGSQSPPSFHLPLPFSGAFTHLLNTSPHLHPHPHPHTPLPHNPNSLLLPFLISQFLSSRPVFFVQSIFSFRATAICPLERKSWIEKGATFDFTLLPCLFLQLMRRLMYRLHYDREHDTGAIDGWGCDIIQPLPLCLTFLLIFYFIFFQGTKLLLNEI